MTKTNNKKLRLAKETLSHLSRAQLERAAGGVYTNDSCWPGCEPNTTACPPLSGNIGCLGTKRC